MISKLKKKFIFVIMLCVMFVITMALGIFYSVSYLNYKGNIKSFLTHELKNFKRGEQGRDRLIYKGVRDYKADKERYIPKALFPSIYLILDNEGDIISSDERTLHIEAATLEDLIAHVLLLKENMGFVEDYGLSYIKEEADEKSYIIIADNNFERKYIEGLGYLCITILLLSFLVFLAISFMLSSWILRPVEKSWQQQSRFVSDASHELRTPLTIISANLNILKSERNDTIINQYKWLDNSIKEVSRMKRLIDELLFLARSDNEKNTLIYSDINISDILLEAMLSFEAVAFEKNIKLEYNIEDDIIISSHEGNIKQILGILLDNALKYTLEEGSVKLKAYQGKNKVYIELNNKGDIIEREDLEHIFERFYRADKARSRQEGGYGLGLSIAQSMVVRMKGRIDVSSNMEEGTTFTIELPNMR